MPDIWVRTSFQFPGVPERDFPDDTCNLSSYYLAVDSALGTMIGILNPGKNTLRAVAAVKLSPRLNLELFLKNYKPT